MAAMDGWFLGFKTGCCPTW